MRRATVESKRHLVQVGSEMFWTDAMPRPYNSALKERECGFDGICRDHKPILVADIFVFAMVDGFAFRHLSLGKTSGVQRRFVGHDYVYVFADMLLNDFADRLGVGVLHVDELKSTIALDDADNWFFVIPSGSLAPSKPPTADVGFVNFDGTIQHLVNFGHSEADAMAEIPGGFVADSKCPLHLHCRKSLFCFTKQQSSEEPLLQRKMAIVKNCAGRDSELVITALAVEQLLRSLQFNGWHLAARALNTVRPTEPDQQFAATFVGIKQIDYVN